MDEKEVSEMQEEMMTVLVVEPMRAFCFIQISWTPGCNQKDPQDICERRQASRPPVVSPFPEEKQGWFLGCEVKCGTTR